MVHIGNAIVAAETLQWTGATGENLAMKRFAFGLSLILSLALSSEAWACGDKMVQIGRGVRYQRANSVRSASIVMLIGPGFEREAARRLRSDLTVVGHKVKVVENQEAFASALASERFDIVLSDMDNLAAAAGEVKAMPSGPKVIPMIDRSASVARAEVQGSFPLVMLLPSRAFDQVALISRAVK